MSIEVHIKFEFYVSINDIESIRNGFKKGLFRPDMGFFDKYSQPLLYAVNTLEQFKLFIEFGFDLGFFNKKPRTLSDLLFDQSIRIRYNLEITDYILNSGVFDIHTICGLMEEISRFRLNFDYLHVFLRHSAGRFLKFPFQILKGLEPVDYSVVACHRGDFFVFTYKKGFHSYLFPSADVSYAYKICAIVMFGAKIKTGKRELCRLLHTFLV